MIACTYRKKLAAMIIVAAGVLFSALAQAEDRNLISVDFFETDIRDVFGYLEKVSGKDIVVDAGIEGKVTLMIENPVDWEQALNIVLKMNHLKKEYIGETIIHIYK